MSNEKPDRFDEEMRCDFKWMKAGEQPEEYLHIEYLGDMGFYYLYWAWHICKEGGTLCRNYKYSEEEKIKNGNKD